MKKSYFRRPLAALLSLLMVVGMFTVCGFSTLAEETTKTIEIPIDEWSVAELDANAKATGSTNGGGNPIYHVANWIYGTTRTAENGNGWLFHSQQTTRGDKWTSTDTLVAKVYYNGDIGTASKLGYLTAAYENRDTTDLHFTPDVIANSVDAPNKPAGVKMYTWEIPASAFKEKQGNDMLQFRSQNVAGATLSYYGIDLYKKNADGSLTFIYGVPVSAVVAPAVNITQQALVSYTSRLANQNVTDSPKNSAGVRYDTIHTGTDGQALPIVDKVSAGNLGAGKYALTVDFATRFGMGQEKFTVKVYAGDEEIASQQVTQATYVDTYQWSPDTAQRHILDFGFTVDAAHAGQEISYSILFHNLTHMAIFGASMKQIVTVGEDMVAWDYKDLLAESTMAEMGGEYDTTEKTNVGVKVAGGTGWGVSLKSTITMTKGHALRLEQDVYSASGNVSNLYFRSYFDGSKKIADDGGNQALYNAAAEQRDPAYGYLYRTVAEAFTPDEAYFTEGDTLTKEVTHWLMSPGNNFTNNPLCWYGYRVYDDVTGELLYEFSVDELVNASPTDATMVKETITATPAGYEQAVGFKTVAPKTDGSPKSFAKFDYFVTAPDAALGDEIQVGVWFWADNGIGENFGIDLNSKIRPASGSEVHGVNWRLKNQEEYDAIETQYDATYGYAYKEMVASYKLTEEQHTALTAEGAPGFNILFGDSVSGGDWANYPLTTYRYWIYNATQKKYYTDIDGVTLSGKGGSGTINEMVNVFIGKPDYATSGYVKANQQLCFENLVATTPIAGSYGMKFNVTGEKDKKYTLTVCEMTDDGCVTAAEKTFTATGEAEAIDLIFDAPVVGSNYTFDITTNDGELAVDTVSCYYNGAFVRDQVGAAVNEWTYKDLLGDSTSAEMYVGEYDMTETEVIGFQRTAGEGFDGGGRLGNINVTMVEGHTVRYTMKMYAPNGMNSQPHFRIYGDGNVKFADGSIAGGSWEAAETKYDPTYGYAYKEFSIEVAVTADMAKTYKDMAHWFTSPGTKYDDKPVYWYGCTAYDVTDEKELYNIDGAAIAGTGLGAGFVGGPIKAAKAGYQKTVGFKTVAPIENQPTSFPKFDYFVTATDAALDDEIEVGVWFLPNNGVTEENGVDLNLKIRGKDGSEEIHGTSWSIREQEALDAIDTQYDAAYGYAYKEQVVSFKLTQEHIDLLSKDTSKGFNLLFGDSANSKHDWANYPLTVYRYWLYNKTQEKYYVDADALALLGSGGAGTTNEKVNVFVGNTDYALDGIVKADTAVVYDNLTANPTNIGNYGYTFNLTGEAGKEYALVAYAKDGENLKSLGKTIFTATGEAETIALNFNNRVENQPLVFGIETNDGELAVDTVSLAYNGALRAEYTWDVEDITAVVTDKDASYDFDTVVVGAAVNAAPWEIFDKGSLWTGALEGVSKGDTLRMEVDMGTDTSVTNVGGQMAQLSLKNDYVSYESAATTYTGAQYNALKLNIHPTYAYEYRTLTAQIVLPDDDALIEAITTGSGLNFLLNRCQIGSFGRNVYRAAIVNETTGQTIFEISGDEILPCLYNTASYPATNIEAVDGFADFTVGVKAYAEEADSYNWWAFVDLIVPAITEGISDTDTLHMGLKVYYPNGVIGVGTGFNVTSNGVKVVDKQVSPAIYEESEELIDETYGYAYKDQYVEFEVAEGMADSIAANGLKVLAGAINNDYHNNPMEVYGFYIYNATTETMLYEIDGATVNNGTWAQPGLLRELIVETVIDPSKATAITFSEAEGVVTDPIEFTLADLGLSAGVYALNVVGDEGVDANASIQVGDYGEWYNLGTGEFVVTEDILDAPISFVLQKSAGAAKVTGVELNLVRELTEDDTQDYEAQLTAANQKVADPVIALIDALPETITDEAEDEITAAREAYDALTDAQKALVNNYADLEAAEAALTAYKTDKAAADAVIAKIDDLPEADALTLDNKTDVEAARTAYDELTAAQQTLVSNYADLETAEAKIAELQKKADDQAAAKVVIDMIDALPTVEEVTDEDAENVAAASTAYDGLTEDQKNLVGADRAQKLTDLKAALAEPDITYGDINNDGKIDAADALKALQHSVELIKLEGDQFTAADVNLDDKVDAADALLMLQFSVELIDSLPVEK